MDGESIVFCVSELVDYAFEKTIRQGREGKKELIGLLNVGWVERHKAKDTRTPILPHDRKWTQSLRAGKSWQRKVQEGDGQVRRRVLVGDMEGVRKTK